MNKIERTRPYGIAPPPLWRVLLGVTWYLTNRGRFYVRRWFNRAAYVVRPSMELMFLAAAAVMQGGLLYLMMRNVR